MASQQPNNVNLECVPEALKKLNCWVLWRAESNGQRVPLDTDKARKMPYQISGKRAKSNDASTWATFDSVVNAYQRGGYDGIGCVITPPFVGIDLDDCIDSGQIAPWALAILDSMGSYSEYSPSGKGIKIWVEGEIPKSSHPDKSDIPDSLIPASEPGKIELYNGVRYFTVTGNVCDYSDIRRVNGELTDLYNHLESKRKAPTEAPRKPVERLQPTNHTQVWVDTVIERGRLMVARALDGQKHNQRIAAAKLLGGLIPHGLITANDILDILYDAQPPSENIKGELQAIRDGIDYGVTQPLDIPAGPRQPEYSADGIALCPIHRKPVPRAKNGNGYKCHQSDSSTVSGWCDFWWQGEGYMIDSQILTNSHEKQTFSLAPEDVIKGEQPRFTPKNRAQLNDVEAPEWLLENEIVAKAFNLHYGPSGSGKTFYLVDVLRRASAIGTVVYVPTEDTAGLKVRVIAQELAHKCQLDNILWIDEPLDLSNPRDVDAFIAGLRPFSPVLIIIDTLAMAHTGDENSNQDMSTFNRAVRAIIKNVGCAVDVVHHTGINEGRERGATALTGNVDHKVKIVNEDGLICVTQEKVKNGKAESPMYFRLTDVDTGLVDRKGKPIISAVLRPATQVTQRGAKLTPRHRLVLGILASETSRPAGAKVMVIKSQLTEDMSTAAIYRALNELIAKGMVSQSVKGDPFYITEKGRDEIAPEFIEAPEYRTPAGYDSQSDSHDTSADSHAFSSDSQVVSENPILNSHPFSFSLENEKVRNQEKSGNDESPLFEETPQPQPTSRVDMDYLRRMLDNKDMPAFERHCRINRVSMEAMVDLLEPSDTTAEHIE